LLGQFHFIENGAIQRSSQYKPHERWSLYCGDGRTVRIAVPAKSRDFQRTLSAFISQWGGFLSGLSTIGLGALFGCVAKAVEDASRHGFRSSINREGRKVNPSVSVGLQRLGMDAIFQLVGGRHGGSPLRRGLLLSGSGAPSVS
jgi:hypothetical protein